MATQLRAGTLRRTRKQGPAFGATWSVPTTAAVAAVAFVGRILVVLRGEGFHALAGYDQGVYYVADAFVHGRRPYGGFLLLHPPGIMLFLSPFAALGSLTSDATGMAVARFAVILLGTLNAVLVTRIALRFGPVAAVVGGLFYALWIPVVVLETQTKLEPLGNTSLLLALWVLSTSGCATRNYRWSSRWRSACSYSLRWCWPGTSVRPGWSWCSLSPRRRCC